MARVVLLALVTLAAQTSPIVPKTVEERIQELETRLTDLEKREKAAREGLARRAATTWVRRYGGPAEFTREQSERIEALWFSWAMEDVARPPDAAIWRRREGALRDRLAESQVSMLARQVASDERDLARLTVAALARSAKIAGERLEAVELAALGELRTLEGALIPQARPEARVTWRTVLVAIEKGLPGLAGVLPPEEHARLRHVVKDAQLQSR